MELVQKVEGWVWGGGDPVVHCHLVRTNLHVYTPQPLSPSPGTALKVINEREWIDSLKI